MLKFSQERLSYIQAHLLLWLFKKKQQNTTAQTPKKLFFYVPSNLCKPHSSLNAGNPVLKQSQLHKTEPGLQKKHALLTDGKTTTGKIICYV